MNKIVKVLTGRLRSFGYAFNGLQYLLQEPNAMIHLVATVLVVSAGVYVGLDKTDWVYIIIAISMVWVTEAINTAIERLCDFVSGGVQHPAIKIIKDVSAAAVLIAAMASVGIGLFVFIPYVKL